MSTRVSKLWLFVILSFTGVVFAAACFELGLRLLTPQPENLKKLRSSSIFLYENKPSVKFPYIRGGEFDVLVSINSLGFRDDEFQISKDPDVFRIAVLGDSFEEALQVDLFDTWQKVMGKKLNEELSKKASGLEGPLARRVESYNFGVSGYGTDQEWLTLSQKVWQFSPDMVILAFSPNDVGDTFKNKLVRIKDKGSIEIISSDERAGGNWLGRLARETYTYHLIVRAASGRDISKRFMEKIRTKILGFAPADRFFLSDAQLVQGPFEVVASQKSPPPEVVEGWNLVKLIISDIKAQADNHQVPFLLTVNIARPQVDESDWIKQRDLYKLDPATSSPYEINEVLGKIAKDLGIYFYDGRLDALSWYQETGDIHLLIDSHYNKNGHLFMGTKVAEYILENGLLPR